MRNPLTMHRQGRGPVFQFYHPKGYRRTGWMFSSTSRGAEYDPVAWLLSGGIRGYCVAIGWYRR